MLPFGTAHRPGLTLVVLTFALLASAACSGDMTDETSELDQTGNNGEAVNSETGDADEDQTDGGETDNPAPEAYDQSTELAFPEAPTDAIDAYFTGRQVTLQTVDDHYVYEGDILLPPHMVRFEEVQLVFEEGEEPESIEDYNELTGRTKAHWPGGEVFYAIDPALPDQQRVTDAIAHWEENTNLSFIERTDQEAYVYFTPGSGCSSYVGRIGGKQNITLASACSTGNTIHEIGHAVGLWHEQSRADRDHWITIHWDNIQTGRDYNFKTYVAAGYDGQELTGELDFGSIMMYAPYSFSANGQPTITKADGSLYSAQRSGLSAGDIEGLAALYPENGGEPEYVNGQYYTIAGLTVLRNYDRWYYYSTIGWRQVVLIDGRWRYYFTL